MHGREVKKQNRKYQQVKCKLVKSIIIIKDNYILNFQSVTNQVIIDCTEHHTVRKYIKMVHVSSKMGSNPSYYSRTRYTAPRKTERVEHGAKTKSYVTNESKKKYRTN